MNADITWTKNNNFANKKKVVKVNKQIIADEQATFKVSLVNQSPCWHTFYRTVVWRC